MDTWIRKLGSTYGIALFLPLLILNGCGAVDFSDRNVFPASGSATQTDMRDQKSQGDVVFVEKGDTLYAIAKRVGVPVRALIDGNRLSPPYILYVGRKLYVPKVHTHRVSRGETLIGISRQYDVNVYEMARQNDIESPYVITVGQMLKIPGVGATVTVQEPNGPVSEKPETENRSAERPSAFKRIVQAVTRPTQPSAQSSGKGFAWPVKGTVVSSFGAKDKGLHNDGINILAPRGTPVRAVDNGVVAYAGNELRGFGNLLLIKHSGGWITAYAHNESLLVKKGDTVGKGQVISKVGSTGSVSEPQLHFELRRGKKSYDPLPYLKT